MQQNEEPVAPDVPLMPASITFETDTPKDGWWTIHVKIQEECFKDHSIVPWVENNNKNRRFFEFSIECSAVCDPIPSLHEFIYDIASGSRIYEKWYVDEEGNNCLFESWYFSHSLRQVRIETFRNFGGEKVYNLLVDKVNFLLALEKAYCEFGKKGGWQLFGLHYWS